jgi:hypothetical protein
MTASSVFECPCGHLRIEKVGDWYKWTLAPGPTISASVDLRDQKVLAKIYKERRCPVCTSAPLHIPRS